jgi:Flp pilus assembly protein TadD
MALSVAPSDGLRMKLGEALTEARLTSAARAAYAEVSQDDPLVYAIARTQIGLSFAQDDKFEEALGEYEKALAAIPDNPGLAQQVAGMLLQLQRYDESLAILNAPVLARAGQGAETHFLRGAAYESVGRMPEAEAELWAALQLQPNNPTILNYLGYLWVDSGTRVAEGAAMIARAHAAAPNDGNIQDSLGWAQFRQGQYEIAVSTLEDAVAKEPANAEINDHLGDAYWQVGRQREAGFQWSRVLTLDPDAERKAGVEKKLVEGLGPLTPVSADTMSAETPSSAAGVSSVAAGN